MENLNAYWQACNYLAAAYPEGFYGEEYPDKIEDAEGVREFFKEFAFPDGIGSHCTPEIPG
jgi:xylulose-5-phosphate/fructose-6-phosphate phosphoketolase